MKTILLCVLFTVFRTILNLVNFRFEDYVFKPYYFIAEATFREIFPDEGRMTDIAINLLRADVVSLLYSSRGRVRVKTVLMVSLTLLLQFIPPFKLLISAIRLFSVILISLVSVVILIVIEMSLEKPLEVVGLIMASSGSYFQLPFKVFLLILISSVFVIFTSWKKLGPVCSQKMTIAKFLCHVSSRPGSNFDVMRWFIKFINMETCCKMFDRPYISKRVLVFDSDIDESNLVPFFTVGDLHHNYTYEKCGIDKVWSIFEEIKSLSTNSNDNEYWGERIYCSSFCFKTRVDVFTIQVMELGSGMLRFDLENDLRGDLLFSGDINPLDVCVRSAFSVMLYAVKGMTVCLPPRKEECFGYVSCTEMRKDTVIRRINDCEELCYLVNKKKKFRIYDPLFFVNDVGTEHYVVKYTISKEIYKLLELLINDKAVLETLLKHNKMFWGKERADLILFSMKKRSFWSLPKGLDIIEGMNKSQHLRRFNKYRKQLYMVLDSRFAESLKPNIIHSYKRMYIDCYKLDLSLAPEAEVKELMKGILSESMKSRLDSIKLEPANKKIQKLASDDEFDDTKLTSLKGLQEGGPLEINAEIDRQESVLLKCISYKEALSKEKVEKIMRTQEVMKEEKSESSRTAGNPAPFLWSMFGDANLSIRCGSIKSGSEGESFIELSRMDMEGYKKVILKIKSSIESGKKKGRMKRLTEDELKEKEESMIKELNKAIVGGAIEKGEAEINSMIKDILPRVEFAIEQNRGHLEKTKSYIKRKSSELKEVNKNFFLKLSNRFSELDGQVEEFEELSMKAIKNINDKMGGGKKVKNIGKKGKTVKNENLIRRGALYKKGKQGQLTEEDKKELNLIEAKIKLDELKEKTRESLRGNRIHELIMARNLEKGKFRTSVNFVKNGYCLSNLDHKRYKKMRLAREMASIKLRIINQSLVGIEDPKTLYNVSCIESLILDSNRDVNYIEETMDRILKERSDLLRVKSIDPCQLRIDCIK